MCYLNRPKVLEVIEILMGLTDLGVEILVDSRLILKIHKKYNLISNKG